MLKGRALDWIITKVVKITEKYIILCQNNKDYFKKQIKLGSNFLSDINKISAYISEKRKLCFI